MFSSELLSLAAAACIALSGMLIAELKGRVDVIRLARWQMLAAFTITGAAALYLSGGWPHMSWRSLGLLCLSSLFGIMIASTTYFAAIYAAGPRMTALLFTLASPFSLLLGFVFLGEKITLMQGAGVALVLIGILMAIGPRRRETVTAVEGAVAATAGDVTQLPEPSLTSSLSSSDRSSHILAGSPSPLPSPRRRGEGGVTVGDSPLPVFHGERVRVRGSLQDSVRGNESLAAAKSLRLGIILGVITAIGQALGSMFARPAMEAGVDPFAATAVRSGLAAAFFLLLLAVPVAALHRPYRFRASDLGIAVSTAFIGTGLGMSLLMAALATGNVGIVTTLSSMTPIMILPMVWLRSGVPPIAAAWAGAAIAVMGTALISLGGA